MKKLAIIPLLLFMLMAMQSCKKEMQTGYAKIEKFGNAEYNGGDNRQG